MKKNIHLRTSVDKPETLEDIIEQLATRHYDTGYGKARVPAFLHAVESSSVESYITGTVEFDYNETHRIRIPYITCFLFGCTKEKNSPYDLVWSLSMS